MVLGSAVGEGRERAVVELLITALADNEAIWVEGVRNGTRARRTISRVR